MFLRRFCFWLRMIGKCLNQAVQKAAALDEKQVSSSPAMAMVVF
jgi:hypothetical protein